MRFLGWLRSKSLVMVGLVSTMLVPLAAGCGGTGREPGAGNDTDVSEFADMYGIQQPPPDEEIQAVDVYGIWDGPEIWALAYGVWVEEVEQGEVQADVQEEVEEPPVDVYGYWPEDVSP